MAALEDELEGWNPRGIDVSRPSTARMYDYYLGGKDNFPVDRAAADLAMKAVPGARENAWENRHFLQRAVRHLAELGVDQFLDLGAGLPTRGNVHEIAQGVNPDARVVYVDNDPIVLAHGRALLADNESTTVITADVRDPDAVLGHPEVARLLDFSRPIAVLFVAVLHFVRDDEEPAAIVAAYRAHMAPGSHVVISHLTTDGMQAVDVARTEDAYRHATSTVVFRPHARVAEFFDGFGMLDPGLVRPGLWRPDSADPRASAWLFAGVGVLED